MTKSLLLHLPPGISRKDGITSHGLRHERLNQIYKNITDKSSTVNMTVSIHLLINLPVKKLLKSQGIAVHQFRGHI